MLSRNASSSDAARQGNGSADLAGEGLGGEAWVAAMLAGDFARAFALSDAALAQRLPHQADDPALPYHRRWIWDGTPFRRRHGLVRCYHGLGDTIQFARFLPALAEQARSLAVEAPESLLPLLRRMPAPIEWRCFDPARPLKPREANAEIMELAHVLRLTPHDVPPWPGVWSAVPQLRNSLGLCWQAGDWDRDRSVPLEALLRATEPAGVSRISLQRGDIAGQADPRFLNAGDDDRDVLRTARLLASVTAFVSVDTFVAHLGGATGRDGYVLLKHRPDWRWAVRQGRSVWYPTLRCLRQERPGDWSGPLARVQAALASWGTGTAASA